MTKAYFEGFGKTNLRLDPDELLPEISKDIQQTLSRLIAWDYSNKLFIPLIVDTDGRLVVSSGSIKSTTVTQAAGNVGGGATTAIANNPNRKSYWVQAAGLGDIYVSLNSAFTLSSAIKLSPGMIWFDDSYTGTVMVASDGTGTFNWRSGEIF